MKKSRSLHLIKFRGMTLIEIMVAMAISLIALSAILINMQNSTMTSALQRNYSRMQESSQMALNILSKNIHTAGYQDMTYMPNPLEDRERAFTYLLGCANASLSLTASNGATWGAACQAGSSNDAIAIRYQGQQMQQLPNLVTGSVTLTDIDCTGNPIDGTVNSNLVDRGDSKKVTLVDNRFYIENNELKCWGNGSKASTTLVPHIVQMRFLYGISARVEDSANVSKTISPGTVRYLTSSEVAGLSGETDPWARVSSVRICVLARSANPVNIPSYAYTDCDGTAKDAKSERYLYRPMYTTVEITNIGKGL